MDVGIITPSAAILARVADALKLPVSSVLEVDPVGAVADLDLGRLDVGRGLAPDFLGDPYSDVSLNYCRSVCPK